MVQFDMQNLILKVVHGSNLHRSVLKNEG